MTKQDQHSVQMAKQDQDTVETEVVTDVSEGGDPGGTRTIRVYDKGRGDFELEVPTESRVTFGYFNPAAPERNRYGSIEGPGGQTMRTTALRIYEGGEKSPQLACFLGVDGFRDTRLQITRLRQRVVIESNFEDDGKGNEKFNRDVQRQLERSVEDEEIPF